MTTKSIKPIGFVTEEAEYNEETGEFAVTVSEELSPDFKIIDSHTGEEITPTLSYEDGIIYASVEAGAVIQLYAPTASIGTLSYSTDQLNIVDGDNGGFSENYEIYVDDELIDTVAIQHGTTTTVNLRSLISTAGTYSVKVVSIAEDFEPSNPSASVSYTYYDYVTVTNTLTHCTSNNDAAYAAIGLPYNATITADADYSLEGATVSVTMGGTDITATAYDDGVISIAEVTDALVINIEAAEMMLKPYVEFVAEQPFKLVLGSQGVNKTITLPGTLDGSTDKENWTSISSYQGNVQTDIVTAVLGSDNLYHAYLRGKGLANVSGSYSSSGLKIMPVYTDYQNYPLVDAIGDVAALLDYEKYVNRQQINNAYMKMMFAGNLSTVTTQSRLRTPPSISSLVKISGSIQANCQQMFGYCRCLTRMPRFSLPSSLSAEYICSAMFSTCPLIKVSETETDEYKYPFSFTYTSKAPCQNMFMDTGGTFTGTPASGTTYYSSTPLVEPAI